MANLDQNEAAGSLLAAAAMLDANLVGMPKKSPLRIDKTRFQRDALLRSYAEDPQPGFEKRQALAGALGLSPKVVQVWFQNRRARAKAGIEAYGSKSSSPSITEEEDDDSEEEEEAEAQREATKREAKAEEARADVRPPADSSRWNPLSPRGHRERPVPTTPKNKGPQQPPQHALASGSDANGGVPSEAAWAAPWAGSAGALPVAAPERPHLSADPAPCAAYKPPPPPTPPTAPAAPPAPAPAEVAAAVAAAATKAAAAKMVEPLMSAVQRAAATAAAAAYQKAMEAGMAEALAFTGLANGLDAMPGAMPAPFAAAPFAAPSSLKRRAEAPPPGAMPAPPCAVPPPPPPKPKRRRKRAEGEYAWKPLPLPRVYRSQHNGQQQQHSSQPALAPQL